MLHSWAMLRPIPAQGKVREHPHPEKVGPPFLQTSKFGVHRQFLTLGVHEHPPTLPKFLISLGPFLFTLTFPLR